MNRITFATTLAVLSFGAGTMSHAQLGSAIRKKAAEAVKEASKKDTAKAAKPDSARRPTASAPVTAPTAQSPTATSNPKVWENHDFVPGNKVIFYTDFSEDRAAISREG
jgi:hypothetical protein